MVFSMFRCKACAKTRRWYILTVPVDAAHPGTNEDIDFYCGNPQDGNGGLPPQTNWMPVHDEISPAPKILIRGTVDIQVFDGMSRSALPGALEY